MAWVAALPVEKLKGKGCAVARVEGRQIAVFRSDGHVWACNNRCPHEGYPLTEGTLTDGKILTCNWHNWKFDLESGETLVGGDRLRRYPARIEGEQVFVDIVEPPLCERRDSLLQSVEHALDDNDYERLAREIARLEKLGVDPLDGLRTAVVWGHDRLQYGWTHAFAVAADWLTLAGDPARRADERLVALAEIAGHIADDARRNERYPFAEGRRPWSADAFVAAIEAEDEDEAVKLLRGAIHQGLAVRDLMPALARAALAHYQDFGHAPIYVAKAETLIERLGPSVAEPLLLSLARGLAYASREDLLPEFRTYRDRLTRWGQEPSDDPPPLDSEALRRQNARGAMARVAAWASAHAPEAIHTTLVEALAWNLLHFDIEFDRRLGGPVADNVNWLDVTHGITVANAVRKLAGRWPELWPAGLLQLACFVGRNVKYVDPDLDEAPWRVLDAGGFAAREVSALFDHAQPRFIVSAHLVKTLLAGLEESAAAPRAAPTILAGVNRFLHTPLKGRHRLRTARQTLAFVAEE
jgi:nitrite reductase/ring-hydroxylating ferredoxin subunit